jgi:UDP-glucose 4-epimerase
MRHFVTGGAGFIGSQLVDKLIQRGEVTVYDNLSSGKIEFISHHFGKPEFEFIQKDLLALEDLKGVIKGHDMVFHLAANPDARLGLKNTRLDLEQETMATYNVLEAMRENGIKKIVFSSSGTIYGETPVIPLPEDYGPVLPISLYGAGKVASEALISAFCHTFEMQSWIYRFANIVGPRGTHGVIFDFIHKLKKNPEELEILGDGTQEKPYLSVEDCVDGILFGLENADEKVNFFNLGCESTTRVSSIARMVVEEMELENVRLRYAGGKRGWPGDVPQVRFDIQKIKSLGWRPKLSSDQAVLKAIKELVREIADRSFTARRVEEKVCRW